MALSQPLSAKEAPGSSVPPVKAPSRMTLWTILAILLLLVAIGGIARFSLTAIIGFKDAATVLAVIGAASVGIERVIEGFWTVISLSFGPWWPPVAWSKRLQTALDELNATIID